MDTVTIDGMKVIPARVDGSPDVFQSPRFVLVKPVWTPDDQTTICDLCHTKFSQLKRRHHCRMCGGVRCAKCCNEKIPLPQLAEEEPERVCESCRTVAELVTKSRSSLDNFLIESAQGLASFSKHNKHVKKLVELGGMQTLVALSLTENASVLGQVVSGLHALAIHSDLHSYLAEAGVIKAICKILRRLGDSDEQTVLDGIGALMLFCKSPDLKSKVLNDGGLKSIIDLCFFSSDAVAFLAVGTIGVLAENNATHEAIFGDPQNPIKKLLQLSRAFEEQVQEVALRALCYLSAGSMQNKHKLLQEDFSSGRQLFQAFESSPNNPQIMCNVTCIIGNLATSAEDQTGLQDFLHGMCKKLSIAESNSEFLCHLTRALANFAQHKRNVNYLLDYVPDIIRYGLKSSVSPVQSQCMRLLLTLLTHEQSAVASDLMSDGGLLFIKCIGTIPKLIPSIQSILIHEAPEIAKPF